jgi:hypothetical protein
MDGAAALPEAIQRACTVAATSPAQPVLTLSGTIAPTSGGRFHTTSPQPRGLVRTRAARPVPGQDEFGGDEACRRGWRAGNSRCACPGSSTPNSGSISSSGTGVASAKRVLAGTSG